MKKNSFLKGAFIATLGIFLTKIIGILYVIPFYQIIGEKGGALYGYAYNIYNIFLNISSAGLPMAISKIISEYNALGLESDKKRAFQIGKKMAIVLSSVSFIILFLLAPFISYLIIGDITGGNTRDEITLVIRIISSAILIAPILSIYRGYLQGHKFIKPTSVSQIIEQVVRVTIILVGSYVSLKILNLSLVTSVGIAVFGATVGAFFAYFYILEKYYRHKKEFEKEGSVRKTTDKEIFKQIILYALPLVLIDVFKTLYNSVDVLFLVKVLVNNIGYSVNDAESVMSIFTTWGNKLNMIITSIGTGIIISLVPNLSENFIIKEHQKVSNDINKTFSVLLFFILPMTIGLSLLSKPVWILFYGYNELGFSTLSYSIYTAFFVCLFSTAITIIQLLKDYKYVIICLVVGLLTKVIFNIPLVYLFNNLGLSAHYGSITATILGYLLPFIICIIRLKKKFQISFYDTLKNLIHLLIASLIMALGICLLSIVMPNFSMRRSGNIYIIIVYTLVGALLYFIYLYKMGIIRKIFGNENKKRKLFCEINPLTFKISLEKEIILRKIKNLLSKDVLASKKDMKPYPYLIKDHSSILLRKLNGVDMTLQENKVNNILITCERINGIIINPGEIFSFWKLVGNPSKKRGFKEGLTITKGNVGSGIGGGLCQMANLIHYMVLNSPLEVVELHHHTDALFPDSQRRVPFGTGTSIFYNNLDYRFKNNQDYPIQILVWIEDGELHGELRGIKDTKYSYELKEMNHHYRKEGEEYYRISQIYKITKDKNTKKIIHKELILDNHSKVMYDYHLIPKNEIKNDK